MANNLGKYLVPSKAAAPSKPFPMPKVPQGRPMSSSGAVRSSTSGYGKLQKLPGGSPGVMVPKMPRD